MIWVLKLGKPTQLTPNFAALSKTAMRNKLWASSILDARFAEIALGSSFELETQLLIAQAVSYGKQEDVETVLKEVDEEQKMIMSFIAKLNQSSQ